MRGSLLTDDHRRARRRRRSRGRRRCGTASRPRRCEGPCSAGRWSLQRFRGTVALLPDLLELDSAVGLLARPREVPLQGVVDHGVAVDDLAAVGGNEHHVADVLLVGHLDLVGQLGPALRSPWVRARGGRPAACGRGPETAGTTCLPSPGGSARTAATALAPAAARRRSSWSIDRLRTGASAPLTEVRLPFLSTCTFSTAPKTGMPAVALRVGEVSSRGGPCVDSAADELAARRAERPRRTAAGRRRPSRGWRASLDGKGRRCVRRERGRLAGGARGAGLDGAAGSLSDLLDECGFARRGCGCRRVACCGLLDRRDDGQRCAHEGEADDVPQLLHEDSIEGSVMGDAGRAAPDHVSGAP